MDCKTRAVKSAGLMTAIESVVVLAVCGRRLNPFRQRFGSPLYAWPCKLTTASTPALLLAGINPFTSFQGTVPSPVSTTIPGKHYHPWSALIVGPLTWASCVTFALGRCKRSCHIAKPVKKLQSVLKYCCFTVHFT